MQSFIDRRAVLSLKKRQNGNMPADIVQTSSMKSITQPNSPRKTQIVKKSDKSKSNDAGSSFANGGSGSGLSGNFGGPSMGGNNHPNQFEADHKFEGAGVALNEKLILIQQQ